MRDDKIRHDTTTWWMDVVWWMWAVDVGGGGRWMCDVAVVVLLVLTWVDGWGVFESMSGLPGLHPDDTHFINVTAITTPCTSLLPYVQLRSNCCLTVHLHKTTKLHTSDTSTALHQSCITPMWHTMSSIPLVPSSHSVARVMVALLSLKPVSSSRLSLRSSLKPVLTQVSSPSSSSPRLPTPP